MDDFGAHAWRAAARHGAFMRVEAHQTEDGWKLAGFLDAGAPFYLQTNRGALRIFGSLDTAARNLAALGVTRWAVRQTPAD